MSTTRTGLIIIATFKDAWWGLSPVARADFIERVDKIGKTAGLQPIVAYRMPATPGAFLEVWEGEDREAVNRVVKELQAMGYTRYIEARWLIGERALVDVVASREAAKQSPKKKARLLRRKKRSS